MTGEMPTKNPAGRCSAPAGSELRFDGSARGSVVTTSFRRSRPLRSSAPDLFDWVRTADYVARPEVRALVRRYRLAPDRAALLADLAGLGARDHA